MFQHVGKWEKIFEMYTVYEMHTVYTITHSDDRFILFFSLNFSIRFPRACRVPVAQDSTHALILPQPGYSVKALGNLTVLL